MKGNKSFNTIQQLSEYIIKSNLRANGRTGDKVELGHYLTGEYKETVTVNFK